MEDQPFKIEIISSTEDYIRVLKGVFDFERIAALFKRDDFHFYFDAINGGSVPCITLILVSSAYCQAYFRGPAGSEGIMSSQLRVQAGMLALFCSSVIGLWRLPS